MTPEEFEALKAQHGGLRSDPVDLDPQIDVESVNEITGRKTTKKGPNPTPTRRYVFMDGTTFEARTTPNGQMQVTNPGTALNKAGVGAAPGAKPPDLQTFPDGSLRRWDPQKQDWVIEATKPQGPQQNAAPTLHTMPNGDQAQWNPATAKWDVIAKAPDKPGGIPDVGLGGTQRPGVRVDLDGLNMRRKAFVAQLNADKNLTDAQRWERYNAFYQAEIAPQLAQATAEANAEADRVTRRQQEADARAARGEERQNASFDRQTATQEEANRLRRSEFQYKAGQDAVKNALDLLHYQANPLFAQQFAAGLNTLSSGGGPIHFSPEAFQVNLPDLDAMATAGAQRAAAMYGLGVQSGPPPAAPAIPPAVPPAPVPAPPPVGPVTAPSGAMVAAQQTDQQYPPRYGATGAPPAF